MKRLKLQPDGVNEGEALLGSWENRWARERAMSNAKPGALAAPR